MKVKIAQSCPTLRYSPWNSPGQNIGVGSHSLGRGVSLHGCSSKAQPLLLTLDEGYLFTAAFSDLQHKMAFRPSCACAATTPHVASPGRRPWPQVWVTPPRCCPWHRARGGSSGSPPLASGMRLLLLAAPDLGHGVAPPGRH